MNVNEELLRETIDPYLTRDNLSALATVALHRKTRCGNYSVLKGGSWNRVIAAPVEGEERQLVFKICPRRCDADFIREYEVLRYFRSKTRMPVPEPLYLDREGKRIPGSVLVMWKIGGTVLHDLMGILTSEQRRLVVADIARHLTELHTLTESGFGGVELRAGKRFERWEDFWIPRFDAVMCRMRALRLVEEPLLDEILDVREEFPRVLQDVTIGTLTHYDIWTGNVMVEFREGRPVVSAFIDVLGYYADYARELSSMGSLADRQLLAAYFRGHGRDGNFGLRRDIYSLKMNLQLVEMYPTEALHRAAARSNLRSITKKIGQG